MQQQFARSQPARVEVRQIAAGPAVRRGIGNLLRSQNPIDVEPRARRGDDGKHESDDEWRAFGHVE